MPLTPFQATVLAVLAPARNEMSYLAGGAALHLGSAGERYSEALDLFHTTALAANQTFAADATTLRQAGFAVAVLAEHPGFVSASIGNGESATVVDWAHESALRFLPLVALPGGGLMLHPIDLAINMLVALANRREPRDLVDVLYADAHILPFPALVWAVVEKNPGLNPASYLEQFRRRTLTPEDAAYLRFTGAYDVADAAQRYRALVTAADAFIAENTQREPGALLQDRRTGAFFLPHSANDWANTHEHRGALGGVVAQPADADLKGAAPLA